MHEHTRKHSDSAEIQGSSDSSFGFVFAAVFLTIALYPLVSSQAVRFWAMLVAGVFLALALFIPKVLGPANRLWMKFGELLHKIVSPVALGMVFYLAVLPTGLLMRLLGKDSLRMCFDPAAASYWIRRDPPGPAGHSLNNQF